MSTHPLDKFREPETRRTCPTCQQAIPSTRPDVPDSTLAAIDASIADGLARFARASGHDPDDFLPDSAA